MIYGNPLIFGSSGGGGPSASDAILTVTAPTGSTVTATKGGVTLTPTMWVQAADATLDCALFVIPPAQFDSVNPWTVTATRGTDETASDTVTIDSNEQYDLVLIYFPDGYTKLDYIEGSGTQYTSVDFGTAKNLKALKLVADVTVFTGSANSACMFGHRDSSNGYYRLAVYGNNLYAQLSGNATAAGNAKNTLFGERFVYENTFDGTNSVVTADGALWDSRAAVGHNSATLYIFARGSSAVIKGRLYNLKIYDTDQTTLLFDLYPAKKNSNNVVGLVNIVDGSTFCENIGSGTFAYG